MDKKLARLKADEDDFKGYRYTVIQKKAINPKDAIPKNVLEEIDRVYNQKKLNSFFKTPEEIKPAQQLSQPQPMQLQKEKPVLNIAVSRAAEPTLKVQPVPQSQTLFISEQLKQLQHKESAGTRKSESLTAVKDPYSQTSIEELIGKAATRLSKDVGADCIVSIEKAEKEAQDFNLIYVKLAIFKKTAKNVYTKLSYTTKMRKQIGGSTLPVKEILMEAVNRHFINKGERIVCVADESIGTGYKGLIFVFDVDKIFFNMSIHNLTEKISSDVLEAILNIAMEIVNEGREGRKIGTAFIVGDAGEMSKYARQLIINPFANYPSEMKQITDPDMKETIKGFSQLDGVFFIDEKGTVLSAGTHINIDLSDANLEGFEGFGTRHRYSAAITKLTNSIAVVVSESGGTVRVFKEGRIVMKLP
ncbi:DNA integrity scanning protein DisA nucleotide-binding domain protein [Candidatus Woesearchaeota archaeon]|nr:DNA integrity scanning protein DisA nucleotide-binding domain protein [Candidatus Woesearchaeota archaeon]